MVDFLSKEQRSVRMGRIRSKDTKPELLIRKALWAEGLRYRLHRKGLPGRPDVVLASRRAVVFVHGCYWHAHSCQRGRIPASNPGFWRAKFEGNRERDRRNKKHLKELGWQVFEVWECQLSNAQRRKRTIGRLVSRLKAIQP